MNEMINSTQVVEFLQERLSYRQLCEDWIQIQILRQAAQERGILISEDQVQAEADRQRREKQLERSDETLAWLAAEQVTPDQWEQGIIDQLLRQQMAELLFGAEIERIFVENRLNYDRRAVYKLNLDNFYLAKELFFQVESGEISFFDVVYHYERDDERRDRCGFEGLLHRWDLPATQAAQVFEVKAHQIVPPIATEQGWTLIWVGRIVPAELTPEIRQDLLKDLMDEWLAAERVRWMHYHESQAIDSVI